MTAERLVAVTVGGESRRMGSDKARLVVGGQPLLATVCRALQSVGPVHVVGGDAELLDLIPSSAGLDVRHMADQYPGEGPVGALVTAFESAPKTVRTVVVVACDLPNLDDVVVEHLISEHDKTGADITVPMVAGVAQWHVAVWNVSVSEVVSSRFIEGIRSLRRVAGGLKTTFVVTSDSTVYRDLDSPEDLAAWEAKRREVPPLRPSTTPGVYDRHVSIPEITVDELAALLASGSSASIIDVREPHEYEAAHAPGAKLIPLGDVVERAGELPDGPLYVICGSGVRSLHACEALGPLGHNVTNVAGGTGGWIAAGHAVDTGAAPE